MNGYISYTKDEAIEVIGLCNQQINPITKEILKKTIQYCWERSWFDIAFEYQELVENKH